MNAREAFASFKRDDWRRTSRKVQRSVEAAAFLLANFSTSKSGDGTTSSTQMSQDLSSQMRGLARTKQFIEEEEDIANETSEDSQSGSTAVALQMLASLIERDLFTNHICHFFCRHNIWLTV